MFHLYMFSESAAQATEKQKTGYVLGPGSFVMDKCMVNDRHFSSL